MSRGIYPRQPGTFLHPVHCYEVWLGGNCELVTKNKREAERLVHRFTKDAAQSFGRASGKTVKMTIDGEPI